MTVTPTSEYSSVAAEELIERLETAKHVIIHDEEEGIDLGDYDLPEELISFIRSQATYIQDLERDRDIWFNTHDAHRKACETMGAANGEMFKRVRDYRDRAERAEARLQEALEESRRARAAIAATHKNAVTHQGCTKENCLICDGGLFVCADCGAAEIEAEERVCSAIGEVPAEMDKLKRERDGLARAVKAFREAEVDENVRLRSRLEITEAQLERAVENYKRAWNQRDAQRRRAEFAEGLGKQLAAERDKYLEDLGLVILACPMSPRMRTSPAHIGVRVLRAERERFFFRTETLRTALEAIKTEDQHVVFLGTEYQETVLGPLGRIADEALKETEDAPPGTTE